MLVVILVVVVLVVEDSYYSYGPDLPLYSNQSSASSAPAPLWS